MKKLLFFLTMCMTFFFAVGLTGQGTYNPNQIIIDFADEVTQQDIDDYLDLINGVIIDQIGDDIFLIEIESFPIEYTDINGVEVVLYNVVDIITNDLTNSEIDNANLNYDISSTPLNFTQLIQSIPTDDYTPIPSYVNEYEGQLSCSNIPQNQKIKLGIIDTGIDHGHTFITDYVVKEANVYNNAPSAIDNNGHGTAVAGIIAGLAQTSGIIPEYLEIYIIKAFDENGQGSLYDMQKAIKLAKEFELDVLNLSWGFSYDMLVALQPQGEEGTQVPINPVNLFKKELNSFDGIIVCGAGNNSQELISEYSSGFHYGPADFLFKKSNNLITVAGLNQYGNLAAFSNYGHDMVEIYAPGVEILSPILNGYWTFNNSGTSFSSAIVSASVVQYLIQNQQVVSSGNLGTLGSLGLVVGSFENYGNLVNSISMDFLIQNSDGESFTGKILDISELCLSNNPFSFGHLESYNPNSLLVDQESMNHKIDFYISPNPASDVIEITLMNCQKGFIFIELFDIFGKKMLSEKRILNDSFKDCFLKVDFSNLDIPIGTYFLHIAQGDQTSSKKIIVK